MALTDKQKRFVEEYLIDLNATEAARRAQYTFPNKQGPRLLVNVGISQAIAEAFAARSARTQITADDVVRGLRQEAEYRGEGSSHGARVTAWSWLGKHLAMFVDRHEHSYPDDVCDRALDAELQRLAAYRPAEDAVAAQVEERPSEPVHRNGSNGRPMAG